VVNDITLAAKNNLNPPPVFAYFLRSPGEPERADLAAILSSLIRQFSSPPLSSQIPAPVLKFFPDWDCDFNFKQASMEDLCNCMIELSNLFSDDEYRSRCAG
jgi:hypothetical protein